MQLVIYYMVGRTAFYSDIERIEKDPFEYGFTLIFSSGVEIKIPMKRVNRIKEMKAHE